MPTEIIYGPELAPELAICRTTLLGEESDDADRRTGRSSDLYSRCVVAESITLVQLGCWAPSVVTHKPVHRQELGS